MPTLEDAVVLMARHQLGTTFPQDDVDALVAFLTALETEQIPDWAFPPR